MTTSAGHHLGFGGASTSFTSSPTTIPVTGRQTVILTSNGFTEVATLTRIQPSPSLVDASEIETTVAPTSNGPTETVIATQPQPSSSQVAVPETENTAPVAVIVGGVIGALAALVVIGFAIRCFRRSSYGRNRGHPAIRKVAREGSDGAAQTVTASNALTSPPFTEERLENHTQRMEFVNSRQRQNGENQHAPKAAVRQTRRRESTNQPLSETHDPFQEPSAGHPFSSTGRDLATPGTSAEDMSLMMREMDSLRARMAQMVRRQQEEAVRNSTLATLAPSDDDDCVTAPPAYSELGSR